MSKFLHAHAGRLAGMTECGSAAARLGIKWPDLPWECPGCGEKAESHAATIATLDVQRYEHPEETAFLCMICDLRTFTSKCGVETGPEALADEMLRKRWRPS